MKKRIVSFFLVISLIGALCVPAFAAAAVSGIGFDTSLDSASALYWRGRIDDSIFLTALEYLGENIIGGVSDGKVLQCVAHILSAVASALRALAYAIR